MIETQGIHLVQDMIGRTVWMIAKGTSSDALELRIDKGKVSKIDITEKRVFFSIEQRGKPYRAEELFPSKRSAMDALRQAFSAGCDKAMADIYEPVTLVIGCTSDAAEVPGGVEGVRDDLQLS